MRAFMLALIGASAALSAPADAVELHEGLLASRSEAAVLKRLPAGRDDLVFHGEASSRTWNVVLSASEAARAAGFQLSVLNSVVVLPDRSSLKLTLNGRIIGALPIASSEKVTSYTFKIPTGLFLPGPNKVQVSVAMAHRVDCSVNATYELWTSLDPTRTGITLEGASTYAVPSLDELTAETLAEDGATHIRLRMPDNFDTASINRAARLVIALIRRTGVSRPIVDVGHDVGRGPGFDVITLDDRSADLQDENLKVLGRDGGVYFGRDPASDRLVLVFPASEKDIDARVAELERSPPKGASSPGPTAALEAGEHRSFAELGLSTENFPGRHYLSATNIALPADFFPASDEKVRVILDGAHSNTLDDSSELIFRVNGVIASSWRFLSGREEHFNHRAIDLPMRLFHPGQNEVSIEGITTSVLDQQCDLLTSAREPRLTIAGSSEIVFPRFAHLTTEPQISTAFAGAASSREREMHLYLADAGQATLGAALTVLANMATTGNTSSPVIHPGAPEDGDVPGLVIAPVDELPEDLASSVRRLTTLTESLADAKEVASTAHSGRSAGAPNGEDSQSSSQWKGLSSYLLDAINDGLAALSALGAPLPGDEERAHALPFTEHSVLVAAVAPAARARSLIGIEIPRLSQTPDQWLVITGQRPDSYIAGIGRLVSSGRWALLSGQASVFDVDTDELRSVEPVRVSYVIPSDLNLSDLRPILGGVLSENMLVGVVAWLLVVIVLGVSTHALIRQMGVR
jgi:hypothetical protein